MHAIEQWTTAAQITAARQRFMSAIPGWHTPTVHGVAFIPSGCADITPADFPLVNTDRHVLPAVVLATVVGHVAGTAAYEISPAQLDEAITLLEPAEACLEYEHPNLWRWREVIRPAWQRDPHARVVAAFLDGDAGAADGLDTVARHPAVAALRAAAAERDRPWRERLRALPVFGPALPRFTPEAAPDDPRDLFQGWLEEAIGAGISAPHAATLSTASADGEVSGRTLILKDVDERGWWFATRTDGRKAVDLRENPRAAMTFFWREQGRQVRLAGTVIDAGREAAAADFRARPVHSRAAAIVGTQSAALESRAAYATAFAAAEADVLAHPDRTPETWAAFIVQAVEIEFWSTTPDAGHIRLAYRRDGEHAPWRRGLLWP